MRTRLLKPETFKDEDLADLTMAARVLFFGLWTLADKLGRLEDRPRMIRAEVFPYEPEIDVDSLLSELAKVKPGGSTFLTRYEAGGCKCIQLTNFLKHQKPHPREADSTLPAPSRAKASQGLPKADLSTARCSVSVSVSDTVSNPVSDTGETPALDGKPLDEIECPGCGRVGSLKQSQGRNGNPPGFWCDKRLGCGANWPLKTSGILSQMTSRGRAAIEAMAAAEPKGKTLRKGGAPSWDRPDASQADLDARAARWIDTQDFMPIHTRQEIELIAGEAPDDLQGAVTMLLVARNPHLRQVSKGEAA